MKWDKIVRLNGAGVKVPKTWLFLHYYEALNILFRVENALRIFIFIILKKHFRNKWQETDTTSDDSEKETIESVAKKRIAQAKNFGYLGYPINCPIVHLTTGELVRLINSDKYWKYFKEYFLGSKEVIKNKFDEIINVRNSLAHFRPVKEDDVELIRQNTKHVFVNVEKCISGITSCNNIVPTNTAEKWYNELKTLGTDNCTLSFYQSTDEQWISICMEYNCPVIESRLGVEDHGHYRVLNINSSAILQEYPTLRDSVIYLSEENPPGILWDKLKPEFSKSVNIIFDRKTISEKYPEIKDQLKSILSDISNETDLVTKDNLAKGKLIHAVRSFILAKENKESKYWNLYVGYFRCRFKENDPPEFWGDANDLISIDFISKAHKYPWMSPRISEFSYPF